MPLPGSITVSYTLTAAEYAEGYRQLTLRSLSIRLAIVVLVLFSVAQLIFAASRGVDLTAILVLVTIWALLIHIVFGYPRLRYRREPRAPNPQTHEISDGGIVSRFHEAETKLGWSYFKEVHESAHLNVLFTHQRSANMIPKRALSPEQERVLRAFVLEHSKAKLRRSPTS